MGKNDSYEGMLEPLDRNAMAIGIRKAAEMEVNQAFDLIGIRATATHLVASGNGKAAGIVREMNAKLEDLQARFDTLSGIWMGQDGVAVELRIDLAQTLNWPGEEASPENVEVQAQALVASLPEQESRIAGFYFRFCNELIEWARARDAASQKHAPKRLELQLALNMLNSILFNRHQGPGIRIALTDVELPTFTPWYDA